MNFQTCIYPRIISFHYLYFLQWPELSDLYLYGLWTCWLYQKKKEAMHCCDSSGGCRDCYIHSSWGYIKQTDKIFTG